MKKRIMSLILSVVLILSVCPLAAYAVDNADVVRYTVLILDGSGSMSGTAITQQAKAASKFCTDLSKATGTNYIAVVEMNSSSSIISQFTTDVESIKTGINSISASGGTNYSAALSSANSLLSQITSEGKVIKNIVFLSDGLPQSGSTSSEGPYTSSFYSSYKYANYAYNYAMLLKESYTIYTLGFFHSASTSEKTIGAKILSDLASDTNKYYEVTNGDDLEFTFGEIGEDITHEGGYEFTFNGTLGGSDTATCYYYDSYFEGDSSDYNASLATMSLCLELTSWSAGDGTVWTDDPSAENPKFINARNLLIGDITDDNDTGLGFEDFDVSSDWSSSPGRDTIGVVAARKELSDGSNLIAVAVRGGGYTVEWAGNVTVGSTGDHTGFSRAKDSVLDFLDSYIEEYNITGNTKIWIVGYSRAGAVANLTAGEINNGHVFPNIGSLPKENLFAYCFAVPMGTTQENANYTKHQNIHNVINYNDLVSLVAPTAWDFTRFNANNDVTLPNRYELGSSFNAALENALDFYKQFKNSEGTYIVKETSSMFKIVDVDWWHILPGGEPFIEIASYEIPTHDLLQDSLDIVATDILKDRSTYYNDWEAGVRDILALINGESITGSFSNELSADEFLTRFFGEFSLETLWNIASPMVAINLDSYETRLEKCKENLNDYIRSITDDSELWGTVTFAYGFVDSLTDLLWNLLSVAFDDLFNGDATKISTAASFIQGIADETILRAHYSEINLAWLMSMDKNYIGHEYSVDNAGYRIIRINCPVNVFVYDETSQLIASVIDSISDNENVFAYENANGEIVVVLPADQEYSVEVSAREDCYVSYSIEEISSGTQSVAQILAFNSVELLANETITSNIPSIPGGIDDNGSQAAYDLKDADGISVSQTTVNNDKSYVVSLSRNNMYGVITGSGQYTYGSYAQVTASPVAGSSFTGWYSGATLVSSDSTYRFRVVDDITLQAVFSEPTLQHISVRSTTGGTVSNESTLLLASGAQLSLEAECNEGYTFAGWVNSSGVVADSSSLSTMFTVGNTNATITAVFKSDTPEKQIPTVDYYTLSFETNGGTEITKISSKAGRTIDLSQYMPEKDGYVFSGWYADKELTKPITSIKLNENTTIYAKWTKKQTNIFTDVSEADYFYDAVLWAVENNITCGTSATTFSPNADCTRAQMVTFIWRAAGCPEPTSKNCKFTDVKSSEYYYKAVLWAVENGITDGISATAFAPNATCTRAQTVTFLYRYAGSPAVSAKNIFTDVKSGEYYYNAVLWAIENGITEGTSKTTFSPNNNCTRAQIVTFLYRNLAK